MLIKPASNSGIALSRKLKNLKVGDVIEEIFVPRLPRKIQWKCVSILAGKYTGTGTWVFEGKFCTIPFATATVLLTESGYSLQVEEKECVL